MQRSEIVLGKEYKNLKGKRIAIIGIGGLGSTTAILLARMGLFNLLLIDHDTVEEINIERQILFDKKDIGKRKAVAAKERLGQFCNIEVRYKKVDMDTIKTLNLESYDLIMDCTDNVDARIVINRFCKEIGKPWIYSAAISRYGTVMFIDSKDPEKPCFECFNKDKKGVKCSEEGILNSTASLIASLAASMALEYLASGKVEKDMIRINLENYTLTKIKVKKDKDCVCSN